MKSSEVYASGAAAAVIAGQPPLINENDIEQCLCNDGLEIGEDEWLVQGCIQGDPKAWEDLIDKYKRLIYSIPIKYGASSADAADVFQSVCIEGMNCLPQIFIPTARLLYKLLAFSRGDAQRCMKQGLDAAEFLRRRRFRLHGRTPS